MSRLASIWRAARSVSSTWARCMGLRVWKATILSQPSSEKRARRCAGRQPQRLVVVVVGRGEHLELAGHVDRVGLVQQVGDAGVGLVGGAEHELGLVVPVGAVELGDMDDGQHHALRVPQRQARHLRRARPPFPR